MTRNDRSRSRLALVVDDSAPVRTLLARVLGSAGYQVDVADSVAAASALAERNGYDVAVVDVNLADGERGYDLVAELRSRGDDLDARCLFLTGGATDGLPDDVTVLAKPFLFEDLVEAVRRLDADRSDSDGP